MNIEKVVDGKRITLRIEGKFNSESAQEVSAFIDDLSEDYDEIVFDLKNTQYVSSAGLRVVLDIHKRMSALGKQLLLNNVDEGIMDILNATGLAKFLKFEQK